MQESIARRNPPGGGLFLEVAAGDVNGRAVSNALRLWRDCMGRDADHKGGGPRYGCTPDGSEIQFNLCEQRITNLNSLSNKMQTADSGSLRQP